jgi:hypothetical protein
MKRVVGTLVLMAALAAGSRLAVTPAAPSTAASSSSVHSAPSAGPQPAATVCSAFDDEPAGRPPAFQGELTVLVRQFLRGATEQTKPESGLLPKDIHILVATVPDPLHTLLNLQFDRTIDAIQQAAQDQGYTYDSSWLPWKAEGAEYSGLSDQNAESEDTARRELCPGLILFRQSMHRSAAQRYDDTYTHGLFVFLVGERPTTGINRVQWDNALKWIQEHADKERADRALRVLGPTFSGSVPSVTRALAGPTRQAAGLAGNFSNVLLYTGTIHGCSSFRWLNDELHKWAPVPVRVADFSQNDAIQVDRYFSYLRDRGHSVSEVAILSEDETAYGGLPDVPTAAVGAKPAAVDAMPVMACEPAYPLDNAPLHLYYPRDISSLRSAYQEQSIFASPTADKSNSAHVVLQPQTTTSTHHDTDTVATFSGPNMALAQEAQMYGIIDTLKTHGIRFVVLRSTSSLDYLFLARFIHRAYPGAFVVTIGADLLFGREIDSTEFRGVEALTTSPLLPRGQDWTRRTNTGSRHAHRVFGSDTMEGTYLATRFLITDLDPTKPPGYIDPMKADIADYGAPFWEQKSTSTVAPSTWLSVIGRDGYWPVAVLTEPLSKFASPDSTVSAVTLPGGSDTGHKANSALWKFTLSPAWKFCCGLAALAVCLHFYACLFGWRREDQSMFIQFAPLQTMRQFILIGLGWATIGSIVILMLRCSNRIGAFLEKSNTLWISVLSIVAWLACLGIVLDILARSFGQHRTARIRPLRAWMRLIRAGRNDSAPVYKRALCAIIFVALPFVLLVGAYWVGTKIFEYSNPNGVPAAYRAVHLTNGVSPMVSLLLLLAGFYWWFWHTLSGVALLGEGRPILPREKNLDAMLARISSEMAGNIESRAMPLPDLRRGWVYFFPIAILALPLYALWHEGPAGFDPIFHSLENHAFNETLHALLALALYLLMLECMQLLGTWLSLKRLLLALNRTPLRRTFSALQGLSMNSLWSLSGTSSRARYTVFSHQMESLVHLRNVLRSFAFRDYGDELIRASIESACTSAGKFVEKRSKVADLAMINDREGRHMREEFCQCTEHILTDLILPEWMSETRSMDLLEGGGKPDSNVVLPLSEDEPTRLAEEFVCLIYVGYLQNLLALMRTMVLSIVGVLAGFAFSLAFYPYVPRPTIAISVLSLVLILGSAVAMVYAGLERDSTLSRITNTVPGELGLGFWVRYGSFIGVPILGLLVAQFPAITDFVTSWIEPSLNAAK